MFFINQISYCSIQILVQQPQKSTIYNYLDNLLKEEMNISQLLQLQKKKAQLQKKKGFMLKKAMHKKKLQQINIDQSSLKKGYIQKTKLIKKKTYETIHQKARTLIPVQIQQNASVSSFLINNSNYYKIYERTKKMIIFQGKEKFNKSIMALKFYSQQKHEKVLHVKLTFEKEIDCGSVVRPFQFDLPHKIVIQGKKKYPIPKAIILVNKAKKVEASQNFKNLIQDAISIKQYSQFIKEWKHEKDFKKKVSNNRILILCDWQIYKNSNKFIQNMLSKSFVIFPFDVKKVPYFVQQKYPEITYEGYLKLMIENQYALIKSGQEHTTHLKISKEHSTEDLGENIKQAVIQAVSKLIERNKDKSGNSLLKAVAKTNSSINFCLYQK